MLEMTPKEKFLNDIAYNTMVHGSIRYIVVAVQFPNGAVELITNSRNLDEKVAYYDKAYGDGLCLKANEDICIIDWMVV